MNETLAKLLTKLKTLKYWIPHPLLDEKENTSDAAVLQFWTTWNTWNSFQLSSNKKGIICLTFAVVYTVSQGRLVAGVREHLQVVRGDGPGHVGDGLPVPWAGLRPLHLHLLHGRRVRGEHACADLFLSAGTAHHQSSGSLFSVLAEELKNRSEAKRT